MLGKFIVIEGMDGSGKTVQIKLLSGSLKNKNIQIVETKNPTNGRIGTLIREHHLKNHTVPLADALMFAADRAEQVETIIKPSIEQGNVVISDRYYHSNLVYQSNQGIPFSWLKQINKFFPKPDLTIILDIELISALKRINSNRGQKEKFENDKFLKSIRKKYLQLPKKLKENFVLIDGDREIEKVHMDIVKEVEKIL